MMQKIGIEQFIDKVNYQVHYADYEDDDWTVSQLLTKERLDKVLNDFSITKLKLITPTNFEIELDIV